MEEMRSLLLQALRHNEKTQVSQLRTTVAVLAVQKEIIPRDPPPGSQRLPPNLYAPFLDELWGLIIEGVVVPGWDDDGNGAWPFLRVTEYGKRCVESGEVTPHDPEGFLNALDRVSPLDAVEQRFVRQSLDAYRRGLPDASAVMLGCASEHLLVTLGCALVDSDPAAETSLRRVVPSCAVHVRPWSRPST